MARFIRWSSWVSLVGTITLLVGLGWDALLHNADAHLAEHEGIFTLSNPGHALFAAGIVLIVASAIMFLAGHALDRHLPAGRGAYAVLTVGVIVLAFGAYTLAAANTGTLLNDHHDGHDAATTSPSPTAMPDAGSPDTANQNSNNSNAVGSDQLISNPSAPDVTVQATATMQPMPGMGDSPTAVPSEKNTSMPPMPGMTLNSCANQPITDADRAAVDQLVKDVKTQAARFADFNTAISEGYQQTTAYVVRGANGNWGPAHFVNSAYTIADVVSKQAINPAKPGALVYFRMPNGKMMLLGEMFLAPVGNGPCLGGGLTVWHSHSNLCFKTGSMQVVGFTDSQGNCPAGSANKNTMDMLHVWVFDNPGGPLSMDLTKPDYTAAYWQCIAGSTWCN